MRLLAISEHYFPRVAGTVMYVHETLTALTALGVEAELLVPGPAPDNWLPPGLDPPAYRVTWLEAGYPREGNPTRQSRYGFATALNAVIAARLSSTARPDLLHVLFGLFVMEELDTATLRAQGLPCLATVHNVPPMECGVLRHDAAWPDRLREAVRLRLVSWKNRLRLRRHGYDLYVVPSEQVAGLLRPIVGHHVAVIGHGPTSGLQAAMRPRVRPPLGPLRLLTVGGYAPHKRQHLIPETAALLQSAGVDVVWDVVGPTGRVAGYFDAVARDVQQRGLSGAVRLHPALPLPELAALYDMADIYVQPSTEEGFCMTALDAAVAGLPVIGSPAGALPAITAASGGALVPSASRPLANAIAARATRQARPDAATLQASLATRFSWQGAASMLQQHYAAVTAPAPAAARKDRRGD